MKPMCGSNTASREQGNLSEQRHQNLQPTFSRVTCGTGSLWLSLMLLCMLGFDAPAGAASPNDQDVFDLPQAVAIQGRENVIDQSLALNVGHIPTDSFNRGFPVSLDYTYYFKPYLGWEVVHFAYNFNQETKLKNDFLALNVAVENIGFGGVLDYPKNIISSGLVYTPLYSKSLLFNRTLVFSETSLYAGVGSLVLNRVGHTPMLALGIQGRLYLSPKSAFRWYLREYIFKDLNLGVTLMTDLGIGFELQFDLFGGGRSAAEEVE
jgi:outer membrane beta-barrel protein